MAELPLQLSPTVVWTASALLLSVQAAATTLRAAGALRGSAADDDHGARGRGDPLWMPPCEVLNLLSMACCVLGVFVLPLLAQSRQAAETGFCIYVLLYGGVPLATLGHAEAFAARGRSGGYCPAQERNCVLGVCGSVCVYLLAALASTPGEGKAAVAGMAALTVPACIFFSFFVWRAAEGEGSYAELGGRDGGPAQGRRRAGHGRAGGARGSGSGLPPRRAGSPSRGSPTRESPRIPATARVPRTASL